MLKRLSLDIKKKPWLGVFVFCALTLVTLPWLLSEWSEDRVAVREAEDQAAQQILSLGGIPVFRNDTPLFLSMLGFDIFFDTFRVLIIANFTGTNLDDKGLVTLADNLRRLPDFNSIFLGRTRVTAKGMGAFMIAVPGVGLQDIQRGIYFGPFRPDDRIDPSDRREP